MYQELSNSESYIYGFCMVLTVTAIISFNNINQLICVIVKCGVLFEVRTEFLYNIKMSFGFEELRDCLKMYV
jgi:hypothetical protein